MASMDSTSSLPFSLRAEYWVSPEGNDSGDGSREAPFRTVERAHREVAALAPRARGGEIAVVLADGRYELDAPLVFDAERFGQDGPAVRYVAEAGARPVVSGGRRVTGFTLHDPALNIHRAHVGTVRSRHLVVNGLRAQRARTTMPDGGLPAGFRPQAVLPDETTNDSVPFVAGGGILFRPTTLNPERWRDPATWRRLDRVEAVCSTQWKMMRVPLVGVVVPSPEIPGAADATGLLTVAQPAWTNANVFCSLDANQQPQPGIWSFWQVSWFENAYEFLDQPGEWYLDEDAGDLFYIPRPGEDLANADVELAVLETLVDARGDAECPVAKLSFEGITFRSATWLGPDGPDGYVADQSGFRLIGRDHRVNLVGHAREVARTPGNLRFEYAHAIRVHDCRFEHLGAVALDFATGCQGNRITRNRFDDIASAAIQLGGVGLVDHHPRSACDVTRDNTVADNLIERTGRDYVDSAAIFIGFSRATRVEHNTIREVPWSGIAIGWGWGLLDPGGYPGLVGATRSMWGRYDTPTPNADNRIASNSISRFLENRWDGGAIYSTGWQGTSFDNALRIEGNVAFGKRPGAGGNTFYSDGGSRWVVLSNNASFDNPLGHVDLGPPPRAGDPLTYSPEASLLNVIPYGSDIGGCRTYGDLLYEHNYWMAGLLPLEEKAFDLAESLVLCLARHGRCVPMSSPHGFFNICPFEENGVVYPTGLRFVDNHDIPLGEVQVPRWILRDAGVREGAPAPLPAGPAPVGGGANFPPRNSGPSWNVPRVSLPGLFGLQLQYAKEWWYYVGTAWADDGTAFGLQIQIGRQSLGSTRSPVQIGYGITGIGFREAERSRYLSALGFGLGASDSPLLPASLEVPPVADTAYSARLDPLLEIVGRAANPFDDLHLNLPMIGRDGWSFEYLARASAGAPLGEIGSRYSISARGRGILSTDDRAATEVADYRIALELVDRRGTVMEGISGYVGPALFADSGAVGLSSYECAQPRLHIGRGGTLVIGQRTHRIEGGSLWLDRQLIAPAGTPPDELVAETATGTRGAQGLKQLLARQAPQPKQLYLGDWMGIVLDDGHCLALAEFWRPSEPQWFTGTLTGRPPKNGFGNLYFASDGTPQANGGLGLKPRTSMREEDWDFDVNVLDPTDAERSPHWRSPSTGKTYATAWRIDLSARLRDAVGRRLPGTLYLFALSDNCEIVPGGPDAAFFEGAALVYADPERTRPLGHAFVEQMGFD